MRKILWYTLALLLYSLSVNAQQRQYVFTRISSKEGLASNYVYSVMQDHNGFMWFGTANGLQRYDGRKIIMFRTPEAEGQYLPSVSISQIFEDRKKNFWVRAERVVGIFDPSNFRYRRAKVLVDGEIPVRSEYNLQQDSDGNVFVIIKRFGFYTYDSATHSFLSSKNPFKLPANWTPIDITEDPSKKFYWVSTDSGLVVINKSNKQLSYRGNNKAGYALLDEPIAKDISAFYIDKRNRAWIVVWPKGEAKERFFCYDLIRNRFTQDADGISDATKRYHELIGFFEQKNNTIWAFGRMLFLEKDSIGRPFQYIRNQHFDDYGIKYDIIHSMYEDREENIWVGTDQGAYVFNPSSQKFNSINLVNNNLEQEEHTVTSFVQSADKNLWVGSWGRGVLVYDSTFKLRPDPLPLNKEPDYKLVWTLARDVNQSKIWIGCQAGRLIIYDEKTKKPLYLNPKIFEDKTVRSVVQDKNGNMWLGTQYGHLVKWDSKSGYGNVESGLTPYQKYNTIIYKIFVADDGFLWLCTHEQGVYKIDPNTGQAVAHYTSKGAEGKSLNNDVASDIIQYNDSIFIISTGVLNVLNQNSGQIRMITALNGLPSHTVRSMARDKEGTIWLGMLSGLSRYNFRKNIFTNFTQRDGVINNDFFVASNYQSPEGLMFFGTSRDFNFFKPEDIIPSSSPPDVRITDFKLFNTYLPPDSIAKLDKVRLDHTQNSITIEFSALSFLQKDKIVYYYKLEGIDKEWTRVDNMLMANYTLLPPDNYTFKVYSENGEGIASENITTLTLYIRPPFWRTWWFLLLMILVVAGIIYLAHRIRVNRILAMEKVRTRIARDLHDDMGSTLSTINILSEMAKMKVNKDSEKTGEYLNKISDNSSRMMEAMDDIVWSINPMNDNMVKITARMREFATGVLEAKNIDFTFRVDEEVKELKLDMEARRDFFLLFKEAVNNLAKYSQCRHATIDISVNKSKLYMKIQDDGIGFDVNSADSGNGLTNMRKRAQTLGGNLQINSVPQKGTVVALDVNVS